MAGYGFDRNEVQITKTTLIDKDGFIFETDKPYSTDPSDYDVIFIDYDGTVPYTYMSDEFLAMKKFPPDPQHEGLISRGWNWDFEEAQNYVRKYGALVIGETYSPADGATQITINLTSRLHVPICFSQSIDRGVEIDWGDKSRHEYISGTGVIQASHDYTKAGEYVLRLKAKDGCELGFGDPENNKVFFEGYYGELTEQERATGAVTINAIITKLILSDNVKTFYQRAFFEPLNLHSLSLSNSIESITNDSISTGMSPEKIKTVIFPKNVTYIAGFGGTNSAEYVSFSNSIENLPDCFMPTTYNIKVLTLPERITAINADSYFTSFGQCPNVKTIIIPDNVVSIPNNLFAESRNLEYLYISNGLETIGDTCFTRLYSLKKLHLPENLKSIGTESFSFSYTLTELKLPETLESIGRLTFNRIDNIEELLIPDKCTDMGSNVFGNGSNVKNIKLSRFAQSLSNFNGYISLEKVIIPSSVTTISGFLTNALMLHDAIFEPITPPTINGIFRYAPKDLRIWVPYSADHSVLNAYQAVSALSSRADNIYELNEDGSIPDDV